MFSKEDIDTIIEAKLRSDIYTTLPATVVGTENLGKHQTINVKPLIGRLYTDGTNLPTQEIHNVPVVFPSGGGALMSFPIGVGDGVLLLFSMRDLDNWEDSDGTVTLPTPTTRHHSLTDSVAIVGLYTKTSHLKPNTTDVEIKFAGSSWKMKPNGDVSLDVARNYDVTVTGDYNINITGDYNVDATNINLNA